MVSAGQARHHKKLKVEPQEPSAAEAAEPEQSLTWDEEGVALAYRCRLMRQDGLAAVAAAEQTREAAAWRRLLLPTARSLQKVLADLNSRVMHDGVYAGLDEFDPELITELHVVLDQDLESLLGCMGYTPPPPQAELTADLLDAVGDFAQAASRPGGVLCDSIRVTAGIYAFRRRLEELINQAEADQTLPPVEDGRLRTKLVRVLKTGLQALLPGMIVAGGVAILFPPVGTAVAAAVLPTLAVKAMEKDALGTLLKAAASYVLGRLLGHPGFLSHGREQRNFALVQLEAYLSALVAIVGAPEDADAAKPVAALGVAVTDRLFTVIGHCVRSDPADPELELVCRGAVDLMDLCRNPVTHVLEPAQVADHAAQINALAKALSQHGSR